MIFLDDTADGAAISFETPAKRPTVVQRKHDLNAGSTFINYDPKDFFTLLLNSEP
jgi:hypothetical protein